MQEDRCPKLMKYRAAGSWNFLKRLLDSWGRKGLNYVDNDDGGDEWTSYIKHQGSKTKGGTVNL